MHAVNRREAPPLVDISENVCSICIIDDKVAAGQAETDEDLWPISRRPTGGFTMEQVAANVRLMNQVAMARRKTWRRRIEFRQADISTR
jgi:hypothetical protein